MGGESIVRVSKYAIYIIVLIIFSFVLTTFGMLLFSILPAVENITDDINIIKDILNTLDCP